MSDSSSVLTNISLFILYIIFFSTIFNKRVEFFITICVCIITIISGFSTFTQLYNSNNTFLDLKMLYNIVDKSLIGKLGIQYLLTIIFIIISLLYYYDGINVMYVVYSAFLMVISVSLNFISVSYLPIWALVSIPIMLLIVSMIFFLIKMNSLRGKKDKYGNTLPIPHQYSKEINDYKILLITDLTLIISIVAGNIIPYIYGNEWFTKIEYILFSVVYGLTPYMVYYSTSM